MNPFVINSSQIEDTIKVLNSYKIEHDLNLVHGVKIGDITIPLYRLETDEMVLLDKAFITSNGRVFVYTMEYEQGEEPVNNELVADCRM